MFDYKLIEAIAAVVNEKGFEKAALKLNISQSAISQRIKLLEEQIGQMLIIRESPPKATSYGKKLLKHYQLVSQLENELIQNDQVKTLSIGINEDSLATWFPNIWESFSQRGDYLLDLNVDDQERTDLMLKNGEVFGCIGSKKIAIQGCRSKYLGKMRYRPLSTKKFANTFFKDGFNIKNIQKTPSVIFNRSDGLHHLFLKKEFDKEFKDLPINYIPSFQKFFEFILLGYAYGMVPDLQSKKYLKDGSVIELSKNFVDVPLYWNHWNIESDIISKFTQDLLNGSKILF